MNKAVSLKQVREVYDCPMPANDSENRKTEEYFPTFYVHDMKSDATEDTLRELKIGDTVVFRGTVKEINRREHKNKDGKVEVSYTADFEVRELKPSEAKPKKSKDNSDMEDIDKGLEESEKRVSKSEDGEDEEFDEYD